MNFIAILENVRSALAQIWAHKMRSALTLTGVVLGVLSINAMFSLIGGVRVAITDGFEAVGLEGVVFISPRGVPPEERNAYTSASLGLSIDDVRAINEHVPGARAVPITQFWRSVDVGSGQQVTVQVTGTHGGFLEMRNLNVERGRSLVPGDEMGETPVAVIGEKVARDIFGKEDPLGQYFNLQRMRMKVVGVLETMKLPPGVHMGGLDTEGNTAYIPAATAQRYFVGKRAPIGIAVYIDNPDDFSRVADSIEGLLLGRHRGVEDFQVENVAEDLLQAKDQVNEMLGNFNIVLGCIAGAALLVGGIGILSVMLIAIQERMFEIGIRKAVGAEDKEIMLQFLVESIVLSVVGAGIGSGLAVIFVKLLGSQFPTGLDLSYGGLMLSYSFALGIGVAFGLYPAWLASRKEPVEALRSA